MKQLFNYIYEAKLKKPSDIKKLNQKSKKEKIRFRDGDIYDFSDSGYDADFTYFRSDGDGYIMSKEDNKIYDLIINEWTSDSGRIAGGTLNWSVIIKNVDGKGDIHLSGYSAIFSRTRGENVIHDIKSGNYLEDYLAKNWEAVSDKDKWEYLKEKGNSRAKSYGEYKAENNEKKEQEFIKRYMQLPSNGIYFEITENGFEIVDWNPGSSKELDELKDKRYNDDTLTNEEKDKLKQDIEELQNKLNNVVFDTLKPNLLPILEETFKTKDLTKFVGISGNFDVSRTYEKIGKSGAKADYIKFALDTKKKVIVRASYEYYKIISDEVKLQLNDVIYVNKTKLIPEMSSLFKECSKAWKKSYMKQAEYVEKEWRKIYNDSFGYWRYNKTKGQAKAEAVNKYKKIVMEHDFEKGPNKIPFSLELVKQFIKGDSTLDMKPIEKPLSDEVNTTNRGKGTKLSAKTMADAGPKMDAWHEGTRKQNVGAMSDAKLKMNYKVCQAKGYTKEMDILKAEATKRGIVIESFTYEDYINILNE